MKKIVAIAGVMLGAALGANAQSIVWNNQDSGDNAVWHVYSPEPGSPTVEKQGNIATAYTTTVRNGDLPAGSTTYGGTLLGGTGVGSGPQAYANGNNFSIALYGGVGSISDPTALAILPNSTTSFATSNTKLAGLFKLTGLADPVVPGSGFGQQVTVQARAWYNGGGLYTTYAAAVQAGQDAGSSVLSTITTGANATAFEPVPQFTSFSLVSNSVPEPSTIALGVMGASAFLLRRRMSK